MSWKKVLKTAILMALFIAVLLVSILHISNVLRQKSGIFVWDNFCKLEKDSVDLVFIGTSHQFCTINTDLLFNEYEIDSFMLATSAQTIPMSYYAAMEAIDSQHPKAIVLEVSYCANDFRTTTAEMSHHFFDGMPWGEAKRMAVKDLIEEDERIYYFLNLGRYHSRWKELEQQDFEGVKVSPRGTYYYEDVANNWEIPLVSPEEKAPMPPEMQKYMDLLVDLCKENDVELILYVAPFNSLYKDEAMDENLYAKQRIFNGISDYAQEHGLRYYNLFYEMDAIGLDGAMDYKDSQHFNCNGQEKVTRYMAEKGYF